MADQISTLLTDKHSSTWTEKLHNKLVPVVGNQHECMSYIYGNNILILKKKTESGLGPRVRNTEIGTKKHCLLFISKH